MRAKKLQMLARIQASFKAKVKESLTLIFKTGLYIPPLNERFIFFSKVWENISNALAKEVKLKTIVVIDQEVLKPDQNAGCLRMFEIIKILNKLGYEVTFISSANAADARYIEELGRFCKRVVCGFEEAVACLESEEYQFSHVLISRPEVYKKFYFLIKITNPLATIIYDTVDLHWVRLKRMIPYDSSPNILASSEKVKRLEIFATKSSDYCFVVSEEERSQLLNEVPSANILIIPTIHSLAANVNNYEHRRDILFIGGFGHKPNVDAVKYFIKDILPEILKQNPTLEFKIIGSNLPDSIKKLQDKNIKAIGFVEDIEPYLTSSMILVAPLRFGAGVKGKITQSLSFGLPVVTTSLGAEGLNLIHRENALIADGVEEFAACVSEIYSDNLLWQKISTNGIKLAKEKFSPGVIEERLRVILD